MRHPNDVLADLLKAELELAKETEKICQIALTQIVDARQKHDRFVELTNHYAKEGPRA